VRVCGLKHFFYEFLRILLKSHPVRVCGLKLSQVYGRQDQTQVTPRAGVWIETGLF